MVWAGLRVESKRRSSLKVWRKKGNYLSEKLLGRLYFIKSGTLGNPTLGSRDGFHIKAKG